MPYVEIAHHTYPLRFTARSLLRTQEMSKLPFQSLFSRGAEGAKWLLYCALCDYRPALAFRHAEALFEACLSDIALLYDKLTLAFYQSGFPREGITQGEFDRLLDAAARTGMKNSRRLYDLTYHEIVRELDAHLARQPHADIAPMTDAQMQSILKSFAGRCDDANP